MVVVAKNMPRGGLSIENTFVPELCVLDTAIFLWAAWRVMEKIHADGAATSERSELEASIAMLRGAARAKKEADLLRAEIGAAPGTNARASTDEASRRSPRRI
jgi:hypothetical protein